MTSYFLEYSIVGRGEDSPGTQTTNIAGNTVRTQFGSTTFRIDDDFSSGLAINEVRLNGLVPTSEVPFGDPRRLENSTGPVGSVYVDLTRTIQIDDPLDIPPEFRLSGGGDSDEPSTDPLGDSDQDPNGISTNGGVASFSLSAPSATPFANVNASAAIDHAVDFAADRLGLGSIAETFERVNSARETLSTFTERATELLAEGIGNFENLNADEFAARAQDLALTTQQELLDELDNQLGVGSEAGGVYRALNLFGDIASGDASFEVGLSETVDLSLDTGIVILGVDVRAIIGNSERDVVVNMHDILDAALVDQVQLNAGNDLFVGSDVIEFVSGGEGADYLFGGGGGDTLRGDGGNDTIRGDSGSDTLQGGGGNDFIDGGTGGDAVRGGKGEDTILGADGEDRLIGGGSSDRINGGIGDDQITGGGGSDVLRGGAQNDLLLGRIGSDKLIGGGDQDRLFGGGGNDTLRGGAGNDFLYGGPGRDVLIGGGGADTFVFSPSDGRVEVRGFQDGADTYRIEGNGRLGFGDLDFTQQGSGVLIEFLNVYILVKGTTIAQFDASDFTFV